jgi:hypothetical protein
MRWEYIVLFSPWAGKGDILGGRVDDVNVIYAFYGCAVDEDLCGGFKLWSVLDEAGSGRVKLVSSTLTFV